MATLAALQAWKADMHCIHTWHTHSLSLTLEPFGVDDWTLFAFSGCYTCSYRYGCGAKQCSKSHRVANVRCRFHKALLLIFNSNWRGSIAWTQPIHSSLSLSFSSTLHLTESHSKWLILSPNISQFFAHTLGYEPIWIVDFRSHFIILTLTLPPLGRLSSTKCWIYRFLIRIVNVCLVYCSKCEAEYKYL